MTLYDPDSGFELNSPETSETVNVVLAAWMRNGLHLTPQELPRVTNGILAALADGYSVSGLDVGFLRRVSVLVPLFMDRESRALEADEVRTLIRQVGESFAAVNELAS